MKEIVEQIQYWGFFNPQWNAQSNESIGSVPPTESAAEYNRRQIIDFRAEDWVKVLEADRLRYFDEPIPQVEFIRQELLLLPPDILEASRILAEEKFAKKHPGFLADDLRFRLTTAVLKVCWQQEHWFR